MSNYLESSNQEIEIDERKKTLSIEEEMEELVPELRMSLNNKWRQQRSPFIHNLLRVLIVLFAITLLGFGAYILLSSPKNIDHLSDPNPNPNPNPTSNQSTTPTQQQLASTNNTLSNLRPTAHKKATYRNIPILSGYMSDSYRWISNPSFPDGTYLDYNWKGIFLKHVEFNNESILATKGDFVLPSTGKAITFQKWSVSEDLSHILLSTNTIGGWRHSYFADYYLYSVKTKVLKHLNNSISDKFIPHEKGSGKISNTIWSPKGHSIAWVRDNDIFVTLDGTTEIRVTTDGSKNIINGIADWVYEEEVLAQQQASWFSENGANLAFIKFDDSDVLEYELQYYSKFGETSYPTLIDIKYPKPGTPNPIATLHIASLSTDGKSTQYFVNFGDDGFDLKDRIITQVTWVGSNSLLVRMMNRVQDHQKLYLISRAHQGADLLEWNVKLVRDEKTKDGAWIQHLQPLYLIKPSPSSSNGSYAYVEISDLNKDEYSHLAFYESLDSSGPSHWITTGEWEVASIKQIDPHTGTIYYLSCEKGSTERHLYSVSLSGNDKKLITSNGPAVPRIVDQVEGSLGLREDAGYYNADFSPACTYYLLAYLGPDSPWERLQKTDIAEYGKEISDWAFTRNSHSKLSLPRVKYITVPNDAGDLMNVKLIVPADFDESGATKYPVLFQVYGGPNSQTVSMKYEVNYMHRLACLGMISMVVDGRGTGFKGRKYRAAVSTRLGELEALDQVAAAKWAASQPYVDGKRIGIWGWSYGGYLTSKVIETNSGAFALGMAVAPVTDWKFYDTVYTERYMKTPQMNPEGYKKSAVEKMDGFKNSKFLVIHGTADDNVHFQNSAELVWHLTGAHVTSYTVQFYTDSDHSITANGAQPQVYEKLTTFMCSQYDMPCDLDE